MAHFAGLDVSVAETSICIVDEHGKIARERKVPTEPEEIIAALKGAGQVCERVGLEAGPLSQWLYGELAEAGLPVICIETRHIRAVLEAQINKTDRNDARGIAQMMRVGLFRPVRGRPPPRRHPPSHVGQRNSVPVGTTSYRMRQRAAAEAAALRAPPPGGGMSLAGDDGKGKSALRGGRLKLTAVEQIVLPSPSDPILGRPASTPKRSANPAGLPNAQRRRPEELAFSLARIEKPRRKAAVREAFHACTCVRR